MAIAAADPDHAATREDLTEALRYLCHAARRELPVVGSPNRPTPWDRRHQAINELLSNLELFDGSH